MKNLKSKIIGMIGGLGLLCVACCTLPVLGILGLGTLEALLCDNPYAIGIGILMAVGALAYLFKRHVCCKPGAAACSIECACRSA